MKKKLILIAALAASCCATVFGQSIEKTSCLWIDPLKNISNITTRRGVIEILDKASKAGFQAVAIGIKANNGHVLYESKIAPRLLEWKGKRLPLDFDIIGTFLTEGRSRDLQVYALFPVFAEGEMFERSGLLYQEHPDWQSNVYVVENETPQVIPITQWGYGSVAFANPHNPNVLNYEISVLQEFLDEYTEYSIDGILLDKLRFSGIEADFSSDSRTGFENYLNNNSLNWWPEDIFAWQTVDDVWEPVPGELFNVWLEYRANCIKTAISRIVLGIRDKDAAVPIGNFVGAWYPTYYEYGVNWASETAKYEEDWATSSYPSTSITEKVDYSVIGCFFPRPTIEETEKINAEWWMSVEGSATLAMEKVDDLTPVYGAILAGQFKGAEVNFQKSLQMARDITNGLYVTDVSHLNQYKLWDAMESVLKSAPPKRTRNKPGLGKEPLLK